MQEPINFRVDKQLKQKAVLMAAGQGQNLTEYLTSLLQEKIDSLDPKRKEALEWLVERPDLDKPRTVTDAKEPYRVGGKPTKK